MFLYNHRRNFGDELSPYIISKILPGEFIYWRKPFCLKNFFSDIIRFCKRALLRSGETGDLLSYEINRKTLIAIGSIIEEATSSTIVWGAGISHKNTKISRGADIRAVRGPRTIKRMKDLGIDTKGITIGDPAILLPKFYLPNTKQDKYGIGIIAHNQDCEGIRASLQKLGLFSKVRFISLRHPNVERIIDAICSCESIYSTSLHGIIVAHAYGIPALQVEYTKLIGDGVKFWDYFESVGIEPYAPINIQEIYDDIKPLKITPQTLPSKSKILEIQESLLGSFPFKV